MSDSDSLHARLSSALKARHGGTAGAIHALASTGFSPRQIRSWCERQTFPSLADLFQLIEAHPDDGEMLLEVMGRPLARWSMILAGGAAARRSTGERTAADWIGGRLDLSDALRRMADPNLAKFWITGDGVLHSVDDLAEGVLELRGVEVSPDVDASAFAVRKFGWIKVTVPPDGPARAEMRLASVSPEALGALIAAAHGLSRHGLIIAHELEVLPPLPAPVIEALGPRLLALVDIANGSDVEGVDAADIDAGELAADPIFGPVIEAWRLSGGVLSQGLADRLTAYAPQAMLYRVEEDRGVVVEAVGAKLPLLYRARPSDVIGRPVINAPMPAGYLASVCATQARVIAQRVPRLRRVKCRDSDQKPVSYTNALLPFIKGGRVHGLMGITGHLKMAGVR